MKNIHFVSLLKKHIALKNISLKKFSKSIGIDTSYLSKILKFQRNPPYDAGILRKIAKALDIDYKIVFFSAGRIPEELIPEFLNTLKPKKTKTQKIEKPTTALPSTSTIKEELL